jgi:RHS repeat-associated protein
MTLPDGTVISDTYDDDACTLLSREFSGADNARATSFEYSNGKLSGISHGDNDNIIGYTFAYDGDKLASVNKGSTTIEEHEHTDITRDSYYPTKTGKLYSVLSDFDIYERLTKTDNKVQNTYDVKCEYDSNGNLIPCSNNGSALLATSKDLTNNQTEKYQYNAQRQISKKQTVNSSGTLISEETFDYDEIGRLTSDICTYDKQNSKSVKTVTLYEKDVSHPLADNTVNRYSYYLNDASSPIAQAGYDFDCFNRIASKFCAINGKEFTKNITYNKSKPRILVETLDGRPLLISEYTYDNMGRIASETAGGYTTTYTYDEYDQLVRENNQALDKSFQYEYNGIGNIVSVKAYGYTPAGTELSGTPRKSEAFIYGDTANPDRLTSFNGADITYNANGGVATYDGYDYTWSKGKLTTIRKVLENSSRAIGLPALQSSITYSFGYNGLGQRVSSGYNYVNISSSSLQMGELTAYSKKFSYDHSGRLIYETNTKTYYQEGSETYEIVYLYDDNGVVGMAYIKNGVTSSYYFQKNLMGDVVAIYDTNGAKIASYNYDAWGNCTITNDTTNYTIAHANPFRYRSYYYDEDTKLYYLKARYYSPEFRRFISPDDTSYLNPESVNGLNLYCYCNNNPVMLTDPQGTAGAIVWLVALCVGVGALVGGIKGYLMDSPFGSNIDVSNTKLPQNGVPNSTNLNEDQYIDDTTELSGGERALNALKGALLGAWTGAMTSMVLGVIMTLYGATTGAGALIPSGIGTYALGHALTLIFSPILFATGIKVDIVDEDPTKKYETGLPQFK